MTARRGLLGALATLAVATSSCVAVVERHDLGWATFDWTLEEHRDSTLCAEHRAATMDVAIYDDAQRLVAHVAPPCAAFAATVELDRGRYSATMVLLDANGHAVSTTLDVLPFTVWHGDLTYVAADFPATSFY